LYINHKKIKGKKCIHVTRLIYVIGQELRSHNTSYCLIEVFTKGRFYFFML